MATKTVLKSNNIKDLYNAESLYDSYFKTLSDEISFLKSPAKLKAIGLLSFFGVIDKHNQELSKTFIQKFHIDWDELWVTFLDLEKSELVDVFAQETAKISDQVLATYAFYKAFIDSTSATISYPEWIITFINSHQHKIEKSVADVINTFGFHELRDRFNSLLIPVQSAIKDDTQTLYRFYDVFWFYRDIDTLAFVKGWVAGLEQEVYSFTELEFAASGNNYSYSTDYIDLLKKFWYQYTDQSKNALELGLAIIYKRPSRIPDMLKVINENFSFHRYDYREDYCRQMMLFECLQASAKTEQQQIADGIFLSISNLFLECESTQVEGTGDGRMTIYTFQPPSTNSLKELRQAVLKRLFFLYDQSPGKVLSILEKYALGAIKYDPDLYSGEQGLMFNFIKTKLSVKEYRHCKLVQQYQKLLNEAGIKPLEDVNLFVNSEIMAFAKLFVDEDDDDFNYDKKLEAQKEQFRQLFKNKPVSYLDEAFRGIQNITTSKQHFVDLGLQNLLCALAEIDTDFFNRALQLIIDNDYPICANDGWAITYVIRNKLVSPRDFYTSISARSYKQKQIWRQAFFSELDPNDIDGFFLFEFVGFLETIQPNFYVADPEKYHKYTPIFLANVSKLAGAGSHSNFVTYATQILLANSATSKVFFDRKFCEKCNQFFSDQIRLFKDVFVYQKTKDPRYDYFGTEMAAISGYDNYFLIEYINLRVKDAPKYNFKIDDLDISFVWEYVNHSDIVKQALEIIIKKAPLLISFEHTANTLFKRRNANDIILNRMLKFVSSFITQHHSSIKHMKVIMNVILFSFPNQVLTFFKEMLLQNKNVALIKELMFEKGGAYSGSRVPIIDKEILFVRSQIDLIRTLPNILDYAEHISYFEQKIGWLTESRNQELKNDFKEWQG